MNKMTEEELIKDIEDMLNYNPKIRELSGMEILSISKLLKLCNKQKEEIERLKNIEDYAKLGKETLLDTIHKQEKEIEKYHNVITTLNDDWVSKVQIRDIIKELEENIKNYNESSYYDPFYNTDYIARVNAQIIILKTLLKEGEPDAK